MKQLNDTTTYRKIGTEFNTNVIFAKLRLLLEKHHKLYDQPNQLSHLAMSLLQLEKHPTCRLALFYCLPKIHKPTIAGRGISSNINAPTEISSKYLDNILQPLRQYLNTVCFSSDDCIADIQGLQLSEDDERISADVTSLYPSIPIDYGINAMKSILTEFADRCSHIYNREDINFICDLMHFILTNNYMQFNHEIYLQIMGTAMGTPAAVSYSDVVVYFLEIQFLLKLLADKLVSLYRRYIDDLFIIAKKNSGIIERFNEQCASIQLDVYTHGQSAIFLDMVISITPDFQLSTTLYQKPINSFIYLTPFSAHRPSVLINFIREELNRCRLRCSDDTDYVTKKNNFYLRLLARGHSPEFLAQHFSTQVNRQPLLDKVILRRQLAIQRRNKRQLKRIPTNSITYVVPTPDPNIPLNLKRHLEFTTELANSTKFQRTVSSKRLQVTFKHGRAASSYITAHRNVRQKTDHTPPTLQPN
jgi:hypothetical protein